MMTPKPPRNWRCPSRSECSSASAQGEALESAVDPLERAHGPSKDLELADGRPHDRAHGAGHPTVVTEADDEQAASVDGDRREVGEPTSRESFVIGAAGSVLGLAALAALAAVRPRRDV